MEVSTKTTLCSPTTMCHPEYTAFICHIEGRTHLFLYWFTICLVLSSQSYCSTGSYNEQKQSCGETLLLHHRHKNKADNRTDGPVNQSPYRRNKENLYGSGLLSWVGTPLWVTKRQVRVPRGFTDIILLMECFHHDYSIFLE